MKPLAVLFVFLTLLLSIQPPIALAGHNIGGTCCQEDACAGKGSEEDKDAEAEGKETSPCNPFQCHTCCFLFLPVFPVYAWIQEDVVLAHFTLHPAFFYSLYPPAFWQPPKIG